MTDPTDETQPHPTPAGGTVPPSGDVPPPPGAMPPPGVASGSSEPPPPPPPPSAPAPDPAPGAPPLRANPDRPAASDWREPPWFPPRDRSRDRGPSTVAIVVGLGLLAVGIYYFLQRTLGLDIPNIRWGSLWPLILIVIGGLIVLRAAGRR